MSIQRRVSIGSLIVVNKFPKGHQVKLFGIASSNGHTEYVATNDLSQSDADAAAQACQVRWKVELFHREIKQVTSIGNCQCRPMRAQEIISPVVLQRVACPLGKKQFTGSKLSGRLVLSVLHLACPAINYFQQSKSVSKSNSSS